MNLPKPEIDRDSAMKLWIEEHSDYAKEQVALNNVGIIGIVMKSLNLNMLDEDLFATGLLGLVKAINNFDADKGFKFSAYATQSIRNELLMDFRKKRIVPYFSIDEFCSLKDGDEVSYADVIADSKRFEDTVVADVQFNEVISSLNEKEKRIISLKMNGKTQREIAKICGISQPQISRIIKNVLLRTNTMEGTKREKED